MTGLSPLVLGISQKFRQKLRHAGILLLAFDIEMLINGISAVEKCIYLSTNLMLRMIQSAFSLPVIRAAAQPILWTGSATFISIHGLSCSTLFVMNLWGTEKYSCVTSFFSDNLLKLIFRGYFVAGGAGYALFLSISRCLKK